MASECYSGTFPIYNQNDLVLPNLQSTHKCVADEGVCYTSVTYGGGQVVAQVGWWPKQDGMRQLAWWGTPECKNEAGRLICLCVDDLCNTFLPTFSEEVPEGNELQGQLLIVITAALLFVLIFAFFQYIVNSVKRSSNYNQDIERGEAMGNNSNHLNCQQTHNLPEVSIIDSYPELVKRPAPVKRHLSSPPSLSSPFKHDEVVTEADSNIKPKGGKTRDNSSLVLPVKSLSNSNHCEYEPQRDGFPYPVKSVSLNHRKLISQVTRETVSNLNKEIDRHGKCGSNGQTGIETHV